MKEFWNALMRDCSENHVNSVLWRTLAALAGLVYATHFFIIGNIVSGFVGLFVFAIYGTLIFRRLTGREKTGEQT